ncbi:hypothetical protein GCM10009414_08140 [Tatumella terrea]|uniref:DUF6515 family protein n=1 Tax=Tatumella terrea TaxID=419007 RepID=UPI0031E2EC37
MKKVIPSLLALTLIMPGIALAYPHGPGPGFGGPGPGFGGPGWRGGPGPGGGGFLPDLATGVLIGGLTYYLLNGIYYQRQGNDYVVVNPPPQSTPQQLQALDYNGKRYYVQSGHYYQRNIDGEYIEVPRPDGL